MSSYVLSDRERSELSRLAFQHTVWKGETDQLYEQAGLAQAKRILELGCGPGYCVMDLAQGEAEQIVAIDASAAFHAHLTEWVATHLMQGVIEPICADVTKYALPQEAFDACLCRWVLMFLPDAETIVQRVFRSLQPGGVFAMMEYGPFLDISVTPRSKDFDKVYQGVFQLISQWGGNPDIGLQLPQMLRNAGFAHVEATAISKTGKPGSPLWQWIEATGENHSNLVEHKLISHEDLQAYYRSMRLSAEMEDCIFTAPTVQLIVGYK
jgi:ubiquinone/menaquinone biosynthesis C-methylase UbiE